MISKNINSFENLFKKQPEPNIDDFFLKEFPKFANHCENKDYLIKNSGFFKYMNGTTSFSYTGKSKDKTYGGFLYTSNPLIDQFSKKTFLDMVARMNIPSGVKIPSIDETVLIPYQCMSKPVSGKVIEVGPHCFKISSVYGPLFVYKKDYVNLHG